MSTIIFRPERLTLAEELVEIAEFNSVEEMTQFIADSLNKYQVWFTPDDVFIDKTSAVDDTEVGWRDETHVCISRWGKFKLPKPLCLGKCATEFGLVAF